MSNALDKEVTLVEDQHTTPTRPQRAVLSIPKISLDGAAMTDIPTPKEEYDPTSHPASPFYSHVTTRTSIEQLKSHSSLGLHHYETDIEAASGRPSCDVKPTATRQSTRMSQLECSVWPETKTLRQQYKQRKRQRGCYPWNQLNRKQKRISQVVILLLIIGIGVGVGVGVSQAVGGTWYKSADQQGKVGGST